MNARDLEESVAISGGQRGRWISWQTGLVPVDPDPEY